MAVTSVNLDPDLLERGRAANGDPAIVSRLLAADRDFEHIAAVSHLRHEYVAPASG